MIFYLHGQFVPEEEATISVLDRSFLYGDGLFESIRVYDGTPFLWSEHLDRLAHGAGLLHIALPLPKPEIFQAATELITRNRATDAILRLQLTRGVGRRGYSTQGADEPRLVMTIHPAPRTDNDLPQWSVWISSIRVPSHDPLSAAKTCNKLPQIMARTEAELAGANEAVMLNTDGFVAEAASSNLFWIDQGTVFTTPISSGALAGVTRAFVLRLCDDVGLRHHESTMAPFDLTKKEGIFLTMSSMEVVEVCAVNGHPVKASPITRQLRAAYRAAVKHLADQASRPG